MWEPERLTTLWAFMACYRDSFTFMCKYNIGTFDTMFACIILAINDR
jgi:hypothetical protein